MINNHFSIFLNDTFILKATTASIEKSKRSTEIKRNT